MPNKWLFCFLLLKWILWWLILYVGLTGHSVPRLNIISGVSMKVFLDETSIWIGGLSKADCPPQSGWTSSNPLRTRIEQKTEEKGIISFFLPHSLFPMPCLDIAHSISLCQMTGIYTISSSDSQTFGTELNYITSFPGFPPHREQIMGFLRLHNHIIKWTNCS